MPVSERDASHRPPFPVDRRYASAHAASPFGERALYNWRLFVIASEAKQSRPYTINKMEIASVVFDSLAMTITGLMQSPPSESES
jgi:hypothetical protein